MDGIDAGGLVDIGDLAKNINNEQQLEEEFFKFFMESEFMDDIMEDSED